MFHLRRTFRGRVSRVDHWRPSQSCQSVAAAPVEEQMDLLVEQPVWPQATAKRFAPPSSLKTNSTKQVKLRARENQCCVPDSSFLLQRFSGTMACQKKSAAVPSDVRKASGLPATSLSGSGLCPVVGAQPRIHYEAGRKRRALPHIRRHSRVV